MEHGTHRPVWTIYLGYAPGVGKSQCLFEQACERRARGEDVVVAAVQAEMPIDVSSCLSALEQIESLSIGGVPALDVPSLLRRRPQTCVVDGLAYDNPPGSRHPKRYEDVEELVNAGIGVLTSINIDRVDTQQRLLRAMAGHPGVSTVPQRVLESAEIVNVDTPPNVLLAKASVGVSRIPAFSRLHDRGWLAQFSQLRIEARRLTAAIVSRQLETYLRQHRLPPVRESPERILVCVTPRANAGVMLRAGRHVVEPARGELFALCMNKGNLPPAERATLSNHAALARDLHAHVDLVDGALPVRTILEYVRRHGITQLFVDRSLPRSWRALFAGRPLHILIAEAGALDIRMFPP